MESDSDSPTSSSLLHNRRDSRSENRISTRDSDSDSSTSSSLYEDCVDDGQAELDKEKDSVKRDKSSSFGQENSPSQSSRKESGSIITGNVRRSSSASDNSDSSHSSIVNKNIAVVKNETTQEDSPQKTDPKGVFLDALSEEVLHNELHTNTAIIANTSSKLFTPVPVVTVTKNKRRKLETAQTEPAATNADPKIRTRIPKIPLRHILYPVNDPRNENDDAILRCIFCGDKHLFLYEDILRLHLWEAHEIN